MSLEHPVEAGKKKDDSEKANRQRTVTGSPEHEMTRQRMALLENIRKELRNTTDALGEPIEAGIFETVATLNALKFPTYQSREGHPDGGGEKGHMSPWVVVHPEGPEQSDWKEQESLRTQVVQMSEALQNRLVKLLDEFYLKRRAFPDVRLALRPYNYGFSLESKGMQLLPNLKTIEERTNRSALYRREMEDFTAFLQSLFFAQEK